MATVVMATAIATTTSASVAIATVVMATDKEIWLKMRNDYVHGLPRKLYPNIGVPDREAGRAAAPPDVNHSGKNCAIFGHFSDIYTSQFTVFKLKSRFISFNFNKIALIYLLYMLMCTI